MTKEEKREYMKKYRETHKERIKEKRKRYYENNKGKISERKKEYNEKNYDKILEHNRNYRETNREFVRLTNRVCKYYNHYFRYFSSIENYLTIMKLGDYSLKRSIMVKLGHGIILEDEAIMLSGMVWNDEDQEQLDKYLKRRKLWKRSLSKC